MMFNRFLGSLIKQGNKTAAKKILTTSLFDLSRTEAALKENVPCYRVLPNIFKKLNNYVEVKKIPWGKKKQKKFNLIPFPLKPKRQVFYKIKWIVGASKEDVNKVPYSTKLFSEMYNVLYDPKKSKALIEKKRVNKEIFSSRSNSHFRW